MGRRSRKRAGTDALRPGEPRDRGGRPPTTRAERDAARRARATGSRTPAARRGRRSAAERPPAPWGGFPLSELVVFLGLALIVWGILSGEGGEERLAAGLVIASLGGAELALREHLAGFRSHSSLLAGLVALVAVTAVALGLRPVKVWLLFAVGAISFGVTFAAMRELFKRRSGGLGFR